MGTTLNGLTPQDTYQALLKTSDNTALSTTLKNVSDGVGNDTPLKLATNQVEIGNVSYTELQFLDGVTSAIQTQLDAKTNKIIQFNNQIASYTLVATDVDKIVQMNVPTGNNLTVPASIFSAGQQIIISQYGAGQTTIVAGIGMTLRASGGYLKIATQYSLVTIIFISATEAYVIGNLSA